jgi:hypothetical protein
MGKKKPVEAVAREEHTVRKSDRIYSDDGRKLENTDNVGEPTPDSDGEAASGEASRV